MRSYVLLFLAAVTMLVPSTADAQWDKPTDWLFLCTALVETRFGADHPVCDDIHSASSIKATLDMASRWLESLGFASPAMSANLNLSIHMGEADARWQDDQLQNHYDPRCVDRYCAWLVMGLDGVAAGQYARSDSSLVLDPWNYSEYPDIEPGYDDEFGYTEVHELFHAVQAGYPNLKSAARDNIGWIIEGTAEHAMRASGTQLGLSAGGSAYLRYYDAPLHVPPSNEDPRSYEFDVWEYGSWEFFDFLGEYLGSTDGIQYLDHLLATLAPDQKNGLLAVDAAIQNAEPGKTLRDAFPAFVARRLIYPCYFSHLGTWKRNNDCEEGPDNEYRFELSFPDTVQREHAPGRMAANGYVIRMEVPEEETGLLTVRVPREWNQESLHLVVDDQLRNEPGGAGRRNEYTSVLPAGQHEFLVRLANVPTDLADAHEEGMSFDEGPIEFMLQREYASVQVTGGDTGDGPPPADIAKPLEFDVAEGDFRVLYAAPGGTLDLDHPICQVRIHLRSRQEDALSVVGNLSPPIRAGTYPIVRNPGGDIDRLGSHLYTSRTAGRGRFRMRGRSGSLEIESVENLMIEGSLWTHVNLGLEGGDVNLVVRAEFSLQPGSGVGGILGPKGSDHPCFTTSDGPSPSRGDGDGRENGENQDPEEQQDPEEKQAPNENEVAKEPQDADGPGGLPEFGESDDPHAPGEPRGQPQRAGDGAPSEDSGVGAPAGGETALQLQFLDERGGLIRSRPHVVRGNHSSERTDISASSFDLQLGFPLDFLSQCTRSATTDRRVEGIAGLLASGRLQQDGQFLVDISDAELDLDSTTDDLRLEIEYERCREPSGCSTDLLVLRTTDRSGGVELATTGESLRVDVTGATLEATVDGHAGLCRNLIDFTFDLRP